MRKAHLQQALDALKARNAELVSERATVLRELHDKADSLRAAFGHLQDKVTGHAQALSDLRADVSALPEAVKAAVQPAPAAEPETVTPINKRGSKAAG